MSTDHSFSISDAVRCGVEEAVIISNLRFWLAKNAANERHKYDGHYWTYNSAKAFAELFPYWTSNKIQKLLKNMELKKYIISGTYNERGYDRTKWYTLPEFSVENVESRRNAIQPNGLMEKSNRLNGKSHLAEPIPDVNTDKKPDVDQELGASALPASRKVKFNPLTAKPSNVSTEAWAEWCGHRQEIRKALTARMCEQQAKALINHSNPDAVLRQSIANGWTGIFPDKVGMPHTSAGPNFDDQSWRTCTEYDL